MTRTGNTRFSSKGATPSTKTAFKSNMFQKAANWRKRPLFWPKPKVVVQLEEELAKTQICPRIQLQQDQQQLLLPLKAKMISKRTRRISRVRRGVKTKRSLVGEPKNNKKACTSCCSRWRQTMKSRGKRKRAVKVTTKMWKSSWFGSNRWIRTT